MSQVSLTCLAQTPNDHLNQESKLEEFENSPAVSLKGQIKGSNMFSQTLSEPFIVREIRRWIRAQRPKSPVHFQYDVFLKEQNDGFTVECTVKLQSGPIQWRSSHRGPGAHAAVRMAIQSLRQA